MRSTLKATAPLFVLIASSANAAEGLALVCKATHTLNCEGAVCEAEGAEEPDSIPVSLRIGVSSGRGNLCTYTYCRNFKLVPAPGDTLKEALSKLSGFTLSEKSGSTGEDLVRPAIDYQLSISEDRTRFVLGNMSDGGFSGWAGTCTVPRQDR
jgi:hypothetical protein